jgi:hypothetical protein
MTDPGWIIVWCVRSAALLHFSVMWFLVARGDWKEQRIAHRYLTIGLAGAAVGYAALLANTGLGVFAKVHWFHYWDFYRALASHFFLCAAAAMALWIFRIWPAGDAKLFMFLGFMYPLISLFDTFPAERLFLVTLINIFIPAALSVFVRAAVYIFDTRLQSTRVFLVKLGWKREIDYFWEKGKEQAAALFGRARAALAGARRDWNWGEKAALAASWSKKLVPTVFRWLLGMASMSVVSYFLKDFFSSPVLLSILCMMMLFAWGYVARALGLWVSRALVAVAVAGVVYRNPNIDWRAVFAIFRNISVFSFFMFLGMNWAVQILSGGWGSVGTYLIPFLFPVFWFILARLGGFFTTVFAWLIYVPATLLRLGSPHVGGPGAITLPYIPWREHFQRYGDALAAASPTIDIVMAMSFMGMFFGLSLVLVRKWDEEVRPSQAAKDLAPRLLLAPSFIDRLREDEEFFEEHFTSVYADGLTVEQVTALKVWCEEENVETVPLAPTMSFAFWIFFGFFLSMITGGRHVLQVLF